ncbi:SusF/SusE family outer membrane protein [Marinoscillum luteum]|uniref:SusF/SusE family outer membrane protein n=1 Tax=Marinoscillum luteum TaxID=861051 RepID=A0ABW7NBQ3_9BACT
MKKAYKINLFSALASVLVIFLLASCVDELENNQIIKDGTLSLSTSDSVLVLQEQFASNKLTFNWTPANNNGTGSSIDYLLEVDMQGNDFSSPLVYDMGKNTFAFSYEHGTLNNILRSTFGAQPGSPIVLVARITATLADGNGEPQIDTTSVVVTPFEPVSSKLYLVGDATPNSWDIANATALTPSSSEAGVFTYQGALSPGNFKFAVSQEGCWCQDFYTKDPADSTVLVYNEGGSGDDLQWRITNGGQYKIVVNLIALTFSIKAVEAPTFSALWIVGDATPSGWNIDSPEEMTQSASNPFIFTYEAHLTPGEFKIFAGPLGDWCGEWFRPLEQHQDITSNLVEQNSGCDVDNTWQITSEMEGRYKVSLNTLENTISINPVTLYIIGDGGPNGWNIGNPEPMTYSDGVFTFNGPLGADNATGEFKFSKFAGDWCGGEWINAATGNQSLTNTEYILTQGCDGPDNKWKLASGDVGNYEITFDLDAGVMTIERQ